MKADTVIIGAGLMGAASAMALSMEGEDVLVIDQFSPVNRMNASNGLSRIFRVFNGEDELKTSMAQKARRLWEGIDQRSSEKLFFPRPLLVLRDSCDDFLRVGAELLREHGWNVGLSEGGAEAGVFYSDFRAGAALLDTSAAIIHPTLAVKAMLKSAKRYGARAVFGRKVVDLSSGWVRLEDGTDVSCRNIVVAAGSWSDKLLGGILGLRTTRQDIVFFRPEKYRLRARQQSGTNRFPTFAHLESGYYGFPAFGGDEYKIANHYPGPEMDEDEGRGQARNDFVTGAMKFLVRHVPGMGLVRVTRSTTCRYAMTRNREFIIDNVDPGIVVATGFCGEGAKFAPVVGEIVRDLVQRRRPEFDISRFKIR